MKTSGDMRSIQVATLVLAAVFSVSEFTGRALADSLPTFNDPVVTTFVKTYSQFVDSYVAAAKTGDASKLAAAKAKEEKDFQQQAIQAAGKLKKVEGKLFQEDSLFPEFLTTYTQKIASYIALSYKYVDESINAFVEKYSKFADEYVAALQAAKTGDTSKLIGIQNEATDLHAQAASIAKKVKDGETAIFQSFITEEIAKITEASK